MTSATFSATASTCHCGRPPAQLADGGTLGRSTASAQTTIGPHSPVYRAVGGGIWCCERPKTRLVPGPTISYYLYGLTRNAQVRSSILLSGSKALQLQGF
mgnify:CR=1 FL=1